MTIDKFILASSEIVHAGVLIETRIQWQQPYLNGKFKYVFFQFNNGEMVTRFKMKFK